MSACRRGARASGRENWVVQGRDDPQRDLWDVESVARHLLPAGSVFAFLAEHRDRLFPDQLFEDLFPSGRGPVGPGAGYRVGDRAADAA
jgi:hypothetical protein